MRLPFEPDPALPIPLGRRVHLPGRGTTFVREVEGPPGAPTVILVHGWIASGGLNWFTVVPALSRHFRLVLPDLRGHGRGIRTSRRFRLADCADDVAALADTLGIEKAIVCGYSLGGPVAQLFWRRHPDRVDGLVLAATSDCFVDRTRDRVVFTSMMMAATGLVGLAGFALRIPSSPTRQLPSLRRDERARTIQRWALGEMQRHDWRTVMDAGRALGTYDARAWIDKVDVPTAIVLTNDDVAVPPATQLAMATRIPGASVHPVDGGHTVCVTGGLERPLIEAIHSVAGRARGRGPLSATASPAG